MQIFNWDILILINIKVLIYLFLIKRRFLIFTYYLVYLYTRSLLFLLSVYDTLSISFALLRVYHSHFWLQRTLYLLFQDSIGVSQALHGYSYLKSIQYLYIIFLSLSPLLQYAISFSLFLEKLIESQFTAQLCLSLQVFHKYSTSFCNSSLVILETVLSCWTILTPLL